MSAQQQSFDYSKDYLFNLTSTDPERVHIECDSLLKHSEIITNNQKAMLYFIKSDADYYLDDIRSSASNINKAIILLDKEFPIKELTELYNAQGQNYDYLGDLDSSLYYYTIGLQSAQKAKDSINIANLYFNMALIDIQRNDLSGALEKIDKNIDILKSTMDKDGLSSSFRLLGHLQQRYHLPDQARTTYKSALQYISEYDLEQECVLYLSISNTWMDENQLDSALYYIQKSQACLNNIDQVTILAYYHKAWGDYYKNKKDTLKALQEYDTAIEIADKKGDHNEVLNNQISKMYLSSEIFTIEEFKNIINDLKSSDKSDFLLVAYRAYAQKLSSNGHYEEAYKMMLEADKFDKEWSNDKNAKILQGQIVSQNLFEKDVEIQLAKAKLKSTQVIWMSIGFLILTSLLALIGYMIYRHKKSKLELANEQLKKEAQLQRELNEVESQAFRAQMNPHFLFNALNSIKGYIINKQEKEAARYISKFSKLIRTTLDNSMYKAIPLSEEIKTLSLYMQLEQSRFRDNFEYHIHLDDRIDAETTQIPPILIQPFIENAIWHGFKNNIRSNKIDIEIIPIKDEIQISITDNGIGRKASSEKKYLSKKSYGVEITQKRIFNFSNDHNADRLRIKDLLDDQHNALGTQVILTIPLKHLLQ